MAARRDPAELRIEDTARLLDLPLATLEQNGRLRFTCSKKAIHGLEGLTDNQRHEGVVMVVSESGKRFRASTLTVRRGGLPGRMPIVFRDFLPSNRPMLQEAMLKEFGERGEVQYVFLVSADLRTDMRLLCTNDTQEKLYLDIREIVTHDTALPLKWNAPGSSDMPGDAQALCKMLEGYDISEEILSAITRSVTEATKPLHELVLAKRRVAGEHKPSGDSLCYVRIGLVDRKALREFVAVLELWPFRHRSPKHQHGGCAGGIKVMKGCLDVKLYGDLSQDKPFRSEQLKAGEVTWMDRANFFCHEVSVIGDGPADFALSLHLYKSCTDEFEFQKDGKVVKSNPVFDFLWFRDCPEEERSGLLAKAQERNGDCRDFEFMVKNARPDGDTERAARFLEYLHAAKKNDSRAVLRLLHDHPEVLKVAAPGFADKQLMREVLKLSVRQAKDAAEQGVRLAALHALLTDWNISPDEEVSESGETLLHKAAAQVNRNKEAVHCLLTHGANRHVKDKSGAVPDLSWYQSPNHASAQFWPDFTRWRWG